MKNKKTTILGYLLLGGSLIDFVTALVTGEGLDRAHAQVVGAASGIGLINASDGGH